MKKFLPLLIVIATVFVANAQTQSTSQETPAVGQDSLKKTSYEVIPARQVIRPDRVVPAQNTPNLQEAPDTTQTKQQQQGAPVNRTTSADKKKAEDEKQQQMVEEMKKTNPQ